jgi:hypothetical protein
MTSEGLGPQGFEFAWCPECGERTRPEQVDSDGFCAECGCTAVGPGIDDLVSRYNHEVVRGEKLLKAARVMRDSYRAVRRAFDGFHLNGFTCPHCGAWNASMSEAVAHDETCEKHPAVVRLKLIMETAGAPVKAFMLYLANGDKVNLASLVEGMSRLSVAIESYKPYVDPEPGKDGAL